MFWITAMKKKSSQPEGKAEVAASELIDARIKELSDWRGKTLARVRALIKQADPEVVEEWKWRGVPVWSHSGIICTGETYTNVVKLTFARGAALKDASGLFNSSLEGNTRRAIDIHEGEKIDEKALKALIRAAIALNTSSRPAARAAHSRSHEHGFQEGVHHRPDAAGGCSRSRPGSRRAEKIAPVPRHAQGKVS
jgi:hypothetical protein